MQDILDATVAYSDRWYSFWQMIGALATVGAVAVALLLGRRDARTRAAAQKNELSRLEAERDEARRVNAAQARRAQAERVHFWIAPTKFDTVFVETSPGEQELVNWDDGTQLVLKNLSDVPIISPCIHYTTPGTGKPFRYAGDFDALYPGKGLVAYGRAELDHRTGFAEFRDVNSVWWRRWGDGRLEEVDGPTPSPIPTDGTLR